LLEAQRRRAANESTYLAVLQLLLLSAFLSVCLLQLWAHLQTFPESVNCLLEVRIAEADIE